MKKYLFHVFVLLLVSAVLFGCQKGDDKKADKKEPTKTAPKKEAPKKEAPKKAAPKKEAPKKEAPKKEASTGGIKIGLLCPLTGAYASEGQDMKKIVTLLADKINGKGGVNGKKIEIVVADDGSDASSAANAAQILKNKKVVAVIGTYGSSITQATQNIFNESKILQIANGSTAVKLSERGFKYFFRSCPRDDEQGLVASKILLAKGYKNIAILHDNSAYAKGLAKETKALLAKSKAKIVFYDAIAPKAVDFSTVLAKMKSKKPDVVFFTGYFNQAALLLRQKKEIGWAVPFVGGDATNNKDLVKNAGKEAAKDFTFISPPLPKDLPSQEAKSFLADFKSKYKGTSPGSIWSVLAGDGLFVIVDALKATRSTDPDKLADYLHKKAKDIKGLTGKISFNGKGDRVGDVYRSYVVDASGNFNLQP